VKKKYFHGCGKFEEDLNQKNLTAEAQRTRRKINTKKSLRSLRLCGEKKVFPRLWKI
jgi:hypothetical protein